MAKRKDRYDRSPTPIPSTRKLSTRNLRKNELGAVIFGCNNRTMEECLNKCLFGLPDGHISYVEKITPGLTLFLFNYSDRTLHGIFEAASSGEMFIDSQAFTSYQRSDITPYAAQVKVKVYEKYRPLREAEFRQVIASNYQNDKFFWFELDKEQASNMTKLFLSSHSRENPPFYDHSHGSGSISRRRHYSENDSVKHQERNGSRYGVSRSRDEPWEKGIRKHRNRSESTLDKYDKRRRMF